MKKDSQIRHLDTLDTENKANLNEHKMEKREDLTQMEESLWTPDDLARWAKIPKSWIYQHCHELPKVKIGHLLRFDPEEIRAHFAKQSNAKGRG
jgi:hypothetical protein